MKTIYFDSKGSENTRATLEHSLTIAEELGIIDIIVSSTKGRSVHDTIDVFKDEKYNLIIVTHQDGFREIGNEFPEEIKKEILIKRSKTLFHTGTHALAGVGRSFRMNLSTYLPIEMFAVAIRKCFGEGTKVSLEMAIMTADAGLITSKRDVICIAGTGKGLDTAWVVKPSYSNNLFDLKMKFPIAKPINF